MLTIILALLSILLLNWSTNRIFAKLRVSKKSPFGEAVNLFKANITVMIILFTICCVWYKVVFWMDNLRTPSGLLSVIGVDPILSDVLSAGSIDELGIPTSPRGEDLQLLIDNIISIYHWGLAYFVLSIGCFIGYIYFLRVKHPLAYAATVAQMVLIVLAARLAAGGIIHISDFWFSSVFNPYTGDISGSIIVWVATILSAIYVYSVLSMIRTATKKVLESTTPIVKENTKKSDAKTVETTVPTQTTPMSDEQTKRCPYCGEEILSVAKKCKHCGEWIKKEDVVVEVKTKTCPVCGEEIPADSTVCPICHEKIEQPRNAFREKVLAEKKERTSESKIYHNGCFWIIAIVAIVAIIAICVNAYSSTDSSSTSDSQSDDTYDAVVEEEIVPTEEPTEEIWDIPGMVQHTEDQGKYIPEEPETEDYSADTYDRSDYYGN